MSLIKKDHHKYFTGIGRLLLTLTCIFSFAAGALAQSGYDDIKSVNDNYGFSYTQIPEDLVSVNPDLSGTSYTWESSSSPVINFNQILGAAASTYSFSAPLTGTLYVRRIATRNAVNYISNVIRLTLVSANFENMNYVREHTVLVPGQTSIQAIDLLPIGSKLQSTTYIDALDRPIEKVSKGTATPANPDDPNALWGDMVKFTEYDAYGRQSKQYLPYSTTAQSGNFKTSPTGDQAQYYLSLFNETNTYNSLTFNNSPLNAVKKIQQSGTTWASTAGNSVDYEFNDYDDDVQNFTIGYSDDAVPVDLGSYAPDLLMRTVSTDENGKKVIEFTNKAGQLILRKVQLSDTPAAGYDGWICTYNVYDDFGMLRFQMQPEAVKWLAAHGWSFDGADGAKVADQLCFAYHYDSKGRNIVKKAPGAKPLYMLYDKRDRVVYMQDGNQRALATPQWTANIYDPLDRPILTTLYNTTSAGDELQATLDSYYYMGSAIHNEAAAPDNLVVSQRDPAIPEYKARQSIELAPGFESVNNDEFVAFTNPAATISTNVYLPNWYLQTYPFDPALLNDPAVTTILKYNFYDDYSFAGAVPFNPNFDNGLAYGAGSGAEAITSSRRTLSMVTGTKVRVLGTTTFLSSTVYYDDKGRSIQSSEENIKGGTDVNTLQYGWDNRLMSSNSIHSAGATGYAAYSIVTKNTFDKLGRVTGIEKKFGSNPFKAIGKYVFDDMGRLKKKRLDPGYTGTGKQEIETLNYSYNIHNEITGINKDYALKKSGVYGKWDNFFGMYLGYDNRDNAFAQRQIDGHVAGIMWNTQGDDAQRKYDFSYDNAGRLTKAAFTEKQQPSDTWNNTKLDFTVSGYTGKIEYDLNGNLLSMLQKGVVAGNNTPLTIDDLRYTYGSLSNKLMKVTDQGNAGSANGKLGDFKDGSNGTADDYVYDDNGNLIVDLNKNVLAAAGAAGGIKYNYLDKPEEIKITGNGTIKFVYDAEGNKLQKLFTPEAGGSTTTTTTYINEYVYKGDVLQYINFEEGRLRVMTPVADNNSFDYLTIAGNAVMPNAVDGSVRAGAYDFFIRDYQSNVRMILTEETHTGSNICTMEAGRAANEEPVFGKTDAAGNPISGNEVQARYAVSNIPGQAGGSGWNNSSIGSYVSRIGNLAGSKVGPNTLLKVMAGDKVSATTLYYYKNAVTNTAGNNTVLSSVIAALTGAISGSAAAGGVHDAAGSIGTNLGTSPPIGDITSPDAGNASGTNPKAYLTVLFFDERFNYVGEGSATQRVQQAGDDAAPLVLADIKAPKNGYAYIYVSNESDEHVYFDNLRVIHERGRITEEDHYYAYGLKIAGISSAKLGDAREGCLENKNLYNDKELIDDGDLGLYDYGFRNYDPQIGRFPQLDPLTFEYPELTNYQYASCEPIANIDIDGLEKGNVLKGAVTVPSKTAVTITAAVPALVSRGTMQVVGQGAKVVVMQAAKNPSLLARIGITIAKGTSYVLGTVTLVLTPMPMGTGDVKIFKPGDLIDPQTNPEPVTNPNEKEDDDDNTPKYIYRSMKADNYGEPLVGESRRMLGVIPEYTDDPSTKGGDIEVIFGNVLPNNGGMSASPSPAGLPIHRKPFSLGGTGKDPVYRIRIKNLGPSLKFVLDSPNHGTIQPALPMSYERYKQLLTGTQLFWRKI